MYQYQQRTSQDYELGNNQNTIYQNGNGKPDWDKVSTVTITVRAGEGFYEAIRDAGWPEGGYSDTLIVQKMREDFSSYWTGEKWKRDQTIEVPSYKSYVNYVNGKSNPEIEEGGVYLVVYGSGWYRPEEQGKTYDVGTAFEESAKARAELIKNSPGFDESKHEIVLLYTPTEASFLQATNNKYSKGKIIQMHVYSHGTQNDISLGGESSDKNDQQDKRWVGVRDDAADSKNPNESEFAKIDRTNFSKNVVCTLWGCNQGGYNAEGSVNSAAQALANRLGQGAVVKAFIGGGGAEFKKNSNGNIYDGTLIRSADRKSQKTRLTAFKKENP